MLVYGQIFTYLVVIMEAILTGRPRQSEIPDLPLVLCAELYMKRTVLSANMDYNRVQQ